MDVSDLYQEVIRDHSRRPRHAGAMVDASGHADGHNPLCGDKVTLYVKEQDGVVVDCMFERQACALCTASASMLTQTVRGLDVSHARDLADAFIRQLVDAPADSPAMLDDLSPLFSVHRFPMRVKCVTLPWHTLLAALDQVES